MLVVRKVYTLPNHNFLSAPRQRVIMLMAFITVPLFLPFVFVSFVNRQTLSGSLFAMLALGLLADGYGIYRRGKIPVSLWLLHYLLSIALIHGMYLRGSDMLFWCYPATFATFFINKRATARMHLLLQVLIFGSAAFYFFEVSTAIRFMFSLTMMSVWSDVLLGVIINYQAQLVDLTIRDPLTNAFNRRHFIDSLELAIANYQRHKHPMTLVALDIDHFKRVNDTFGHQVGDDVLIAIVDIITARKRQIDGVFRLGGEEFAILLSNTDTQPALILAEDIRQRIARATLIDEYPITISLGVAEYQDNEHLDAWIKRADDDLYRAKADGRNCIYADQQRICHLEHAFEYHAEIAK